MERLAIVAAAVALLGLAGCAPQSPVPVSNSCVNCPEAYAKAGSPPPQLQEQDQYSGDKKKLDESVAECRRAYPIVLLARFQCTEPYLLDFVKKIDPENVAIWATYLARREAIAAQQDRHQITAEKAHALGLEAEVKMNTEIHNREMGDQSAQLLVSH